MAVAYLAEDTPAPLVLFQVVDSLVVSVVSVDLPLEEADRRQVPLAH